VAAACVIVGAQCRQAGPPKWLRPWSVHALLLEAAAMVGSEQRVAVLLPPFRRVALR
jgi:hypothetical protein